MPKKPKYIADHLRQVLINGASAPHTEEVQHFFKEVVTSRGWYTQGIRKLARRFTKVIRNDAGLDYLVAVADELFRGKVLEEKVLAVFLLENSVGELNESHFQIFTGWLDRVTTWADHDALIQYLVGPMIAAEPERTLHAFRWAKSKDVWHRRAAAVSLIRGAREKKFDDEIAQITDLLLSDKNDMVQKGLGWLLRESAKYNPRKTLPLLMKIRENAPRLVLRTACETVAPEARERILGRTHKAALLAQKARARRLSAKD